MKGGDKHITNWIPLKMVLFIYSFLSGIGFGALAPVTLQLMQYLVKIELGYDGTGDDGTLSDKTDPCSGLNSTSTNISVDAANAEIQRRTTFFVTITSIVGNTPSLLVTVLASSWLDSVHSNKRRVAILPSIGFTVHMAIYVVISALTLSPWYTLIPAAILGLGGNFPLLGATVLKYLGSITNEEERSFNILCAQMLNFLAQGISQIGIGYLIGGAGFTVTFTILLLVCMLMTAFVSLFLPNIEPGGTDDDEGETASSLLNIFKGLGENILAIFKDPVTKQFNFALMVNLTAFFVYLFVSIYLLMLLQIVVLGTPFCWSPSLIGYFGATKLVCVCIGMTLGAKVLQVWFDDYGLIQIGLVSVIISTIIPVYARTDAGIFLVAIFGAFRMIPGSVLTSNVSKLVKNKSHGSAFGVMGAFESIASILSPAIFGGIYEATIKEDPKFVFKLMAGITAIPSALILCLQCWKCTSGATNYKEARGETLLPESDSKE